MARLNSSYLLGNLCKDPILRHVSTGKQLCEILLAVNRPSGATDYIPVIVWGKEAEACKEYLVKGSCILVDGQIQSRNYTKASTGTSHVAIEVVAKSVEFIHLNNDNEKQENE